MTDLQLIAAQIAPGSECECREDIPTESVEVEWEAEFCWKRATVEKCKNCAGVRNSSEVESVDFRSMHTVTNREEV